MPKHIIKKIWIWIIGVSLVVSIVLTSYIYYQSLSESCFIGPRTTLCDIFFKADYIQTPDTNPNRAIISNFPGLSTSPIMSNQSSARIIQVKTWPELFLGFFGMLFVLLSIGAMISLIIELIYFIYHKFRYKDSKFNQENIVISFGVIILTILIIALFS